MNANTPHLANDAVDHNIDRALSALRDAQPRSGLNSRILASLEHRAAQPQRSGLDFSAHLALWSATSAAILAIASLMILHRQTTDPAQATQRAVILSEASRPHREAQSKTPVGPMTAEPFSTTNLTESSTEPTHRLAHRSLKSTMPAPCPQSGCPTHDEVAAMSGATQDLDAQALADLHAPSHPAPPLPLTPQEKLFLRMLRYGNATELAQLDPIVRAKEDADETTAFKAFFPDPPPLKQPLGDTE
jgi:hypothetical protein